MSVGEDATLRRRGADCAHLASGATAESAPSRHHPKPRRPPANQHHASSATCGGGAAAKGDVARKSPRAPPSSAPPCAAPTKNFAYPPTTTCGAAYFAPAVDHNANAVTSAKSFAAAPTSAAAAHPLTLNSICSSLNGLLAPLGELNFGGGGGGGATRVRHYSSAFGGADSSSTSTSSNSSSGFGSGGAIDLSGVGSFFNASAAAAADPTKAKGALSPFPSLGEPSAGDCAKGAANGLQSRAELEGAFDAAPTNGLAKSMLLEEDDSCSQIFWDARMKDIANAMTYLELI